MDKVKIIKLRNKTLLAIVVIIGIIGGLRTYDDLSRNDNILEKKKIQLQKELTSKYDEEIKKIQTIININGNLITKSNTFINSFKNKDREKLYELSKPLLDSLNESFQQNSRIHFHTKENISFLRVHKKDKYGDNLKDIRPIVTKAINDKQKKFGYEHGKNDKNLITYRGVFPLYDKKEFLGVVEIGVGTNYINKKLEVMVKNFFGFDMYLITLIKNSAPNFKEYDDLQGKVGDYHYKVVKTIEDILNKCDDCIKGQTVRVDEKIYSMGLTKIELLNHKDDIVGKYLSIVDITSDIKQNNTFFYSSLAKPIIAVVLIALLIWWIFHLFYKNFLKLEERTRNILDSQIALVVLSDGKSLIDCNKALLEFYGFRAIDQFKEKFECICNTFEKGEIFLQKENAGVMWIDKLIEDSDRSSKVAIKDKDGVLNIFSIVLNSHYHEYKNGSEYYVITLTNISDLERANAQLIEQSKQASLGEMIGNIAHQWRQPLSAISTVASGVKLKNEYNQLDLDALDKEMDIIVGRALYLSDTIETFRNFIKEKKEKKEVVLQERIDVALNIIEATLIDNHIKFVKDIDKEPIELSLVVGELTQVIINIINNAKDAILENKIEDAFVKISLFKQDKEVVISIEDNAGGIQEEIISNIFEPYFTTKHKSQGTGLGLYMSYKIVVESLYGKLYVKNSDLGAKFYIKLPLGK